jgi:ubiquinone/menaquinone biosynthesis C-methylase UbiE
MTGQALRRTSDGVVTTIDGRYSYPVVDDVVCLLPRDAVANGAYASEAPVACTAASSTAHQEVKDAVQKFYDEVGWTKTESGEYRDTIFYVDQRPLPYRFTAKCIRQVGRYLPRSGRYLLDAGSGAIPHKGYLAYDQGFANRICVDFSMAALRQARQKVGDRGLYLLGDLTNLPILDGAVDAVICNHVLYHIPPEEQPKALTEIWRVLKPGGTAAVVYSWFYSPLAWRLEKLASRFMKGGSSSNAEGETLPFFPQSLEWFTSQPWPFAYRIRTFRLIGNDFLRRYIRNDLSSRFLLFALWSFQRIMPEFAGRYGQYPVIIISK